MMMYTFSMPECWNFSYISSSFSFYLLCECVRNVTKFHVLFVYYMLHMKTISSILSVSKNPLKQLLNNFFRTFFLLHINNSKSTEKYVVKGIGDEAKTFDIFKFR